MTIQVSLSPVFNDTQFFDNNGVPLNGGLINTYIAGSDFQQVTYTDSTGTVANSNPIVLDSAGRPTTQLWLINGTGYNLVLTDSSNTVIRACDNIIGVEATSIGGDSGNPYWSAVPATFNYVNGTQFFFTGDYGAKFQVATRVQYTFSDNTVAYGTVSASTVIGGQTNVTIIPDSVSLSPTVTVMAYSFVAAPNYVADAGAIGYSSALTYSGLNVGTQLQSLNTSISNYARSYTTTPGGGSSYAVITSTSYANYTNLVIDLIFSDANDGAASTLNINSMGALSLYQYDYTGAKINPVIPAGWPSRVMCDNAGDLILMNQLPYTPPAPPAAKALVTTYINTSLGNGSTWTIPANTVYVYMTATAGGFYSSGDLVQVKILDASSAVLGELPLHGANVSNGPDGGSGMLDQGAGSIPISATAVTLQVAISGNNVSSSATIWAYTQLQ